MVDVDNNWRDVYDTFWKNVVETDGQLDIEKVARELHDYKMLLDQVPLVYKHITGGLLSKPHYRADAVIEVAEERTSQRIDDALAEARVIWDED